MRADSVACDRQTGQRCEMLALGVLNVLEGLNAVLQRLSPESYRAHSGELFAGGSIGGHVRHCLDHVRAVVEPAAGVIDYDHRVRGTDIESDLFAARAELERLAAGIRELSGREGNERVLVCIMPSRDGASVTLESTLGRELAFVLSHTVHHNATIRSLAMSMGVIAPDSFGSAPSTLAYKDREVAGVTRGGTCAR